MTRHCFTPPVRPDRVEEHRERHASVRPKMPVALWAASWHAYVLHLRDDGLLVGVVGAPDLDTLPHPHQQSDAYSEETTP